MKRNTNLLLDSKVYKDYDRFLNVISHPFSVQASASSERLFLIPKQKVPPVIILLSFVVHTVHHHKSATQYSMQDNVEFSLGVLHTLSL